MTNLSAWPSLRPGAKMGVRAVQGSLAVSWGPGANKISSRPEEMGSQRLEIQLDGWG